MVSHSLCSLCSSSWWEEGVPGKGLENLNPVPALLYLTHELGHITHHFTFISALLKLVLSSLCFLLCGIAVSVKGANVNISILYTIKK